MSSRYSRRKRSSSPPPLQVVQPKADDADKFNAIKMQYKALFKKTKKSTKLQQPKHTLDFMYISKTIDQSKVPPPVLQELQPVEQPGDTLLDQAEYELSNHIAQHPQSSVDLRTSIENIHNRIIKESHNEWKTERNEIYDKIEALEKEIIQHEESAVYQRSESSRKSNKDKHAGFKELLGDRKDLAAKVQNSKNTNQNLTETMSKLEADLSALQQEFREKEENKEQEIEDLKQNLNMTVNEKIATLQNEVYSLQQEQNTLVSEKRWIQENWNDEHSSFHPMYRAQEEAKKELRQELEAIAEAMRKLDDEVEDFEAEKEEFYKEHQIYENNIQTLELQDVQINQRDWRSHLGEKISQIIDANASKIMSIIAGNIPNPSPQIQPSDDTHLTPELQSLRNTLIEMKGKHDNRLMELEANSASQISKLAHMVKDQTGDYERRSRQLDSPSSLSQRNLSSPRRMSPSQGSIGSRLASLDSKIQSPRFNEYKPSKLSASRRNIPIPRPKATPKGHSNSVTNKADAPNFRRPSPRSKTIANKNV